MNNETRNLEITKTNEMLYRSHCWGSEYILNNIACWHVVDSTTKEVIEGGADKGNNAMPGRPTLPRKKDAAAFIEGYNAYAQGKSMRRNIGDEGQRTNFENGYLTAMQESRSA